MIIFPFCTPEHPLFGYRRCEVYDYVYFFNSPRLSKETTIIPPSPSYETFTDIYTLRTVYDTSDNQTVGFKFVSKNITASAYTEKMGSVENYAFSMFGRFKGFAVYVVKGKRYPYEEKAYYVGYDSEIATASVGWDGGITSGLTVGRSIYLKGEYYESFDTMKAGGVGIRGKRFDVWMVAGYGYSSALTFIADRFIINASYTKSKKFNSGYITVKNDFAGLTYAHGTRPIGDSTVSAPEIQGVFDVKDKFLEIHLGGVYTFDGNYRLRTAAKVKYNIKDILVVKPAIETFYEGEGNMWINAGLNFTFYGDLNIGAYYDYWKNSPNLRLEVLWRLWD